MCAQGECLRAGGVDAWADLIFLLLASPLRFRTTRRQLCIFLMAIHGDLIFRNIYVLSFFVSHMHLLVA